MGNYKVTGNYKPSASGAKIIFANHDNWSWEATFQVEYFGVNGMVNQVTEANVKIAAPIAFTWKEITIIVDSNTLNGATLVKSRIDGVNGNQNFSVAASTAGIFSDETNVDVITNEQKFNGLVDHSGSSSGIAQIRGISSAGS